MEIAIAGGHGKIALLLGEILVERGHTVLGLIRNPEQEDDLHVIGVEPVICDLEGDHDVAEAVSGADMGAANPPAEGGDVYGDYLRAKAAADQALAASGLAYTVVRPGRLTDDPPTGQVQIGGRLDRAEIPRADVAAVLAAVLETDSTIGKTFDVVSGEAPVARAVTGL